MKFKQVLKQESGFTLLELMLVLVLVSVLIIASMGAYQIQQRNFKIDKTALQMQQWLQAGMAFYTDCGQWPNPATQSDILLAMTGATGHPITPQACPPLTQSVMKAYMPLGADSNGPWPNSYTIGVGQGAYANMLQVSTDLPYDDTSNPPWITAIANGIAGRLPNAAASVDQTQNPPQIQIQTAVGIPGSASGNRGFILDMEMVNSNTQTQHLTMPTSTSCPSGMQAVVVSAMSGYESVSHGTNDVAAYSSTQKVTEQNGFITKIPYSTTTGLITPNLTTQSISGYGSTYDNGNNQVLLITACLPIPPAGANAQQTNSGGQRF